MSLPPRVAEDLRDIVGGRHVLTDAETVASYATDWTGRFVGHARLVVRPGSTEEVAAVLARCDDARVAIVPQGGNTGLVGGGVPLAGEVVLSLRRLDRLDPVDEAASQVTVGAGVTLAALQEHARASGLAYAVDLAARDTATVGGTVATNAGGLHVLRYGGTRRQVAGIEAVRADGAVLRHLSGLEKDNTGYDLAGLLCGSEGTLAVVTAVRLRLVSRHAADGCQDSGVTNGGLLLLLTLGRGLQGFRADGEADTGGAFEAFEGKIDLQAVAAGRLGWFVGGNGLCRSDMQLEGRLDLDGSCEILGKAHGDLLDQRALRQRQLTPEFGWPIAFGTAQHTFQHDAQRIGVETENTPCRAVFCLQNHLVAGA
jgi:hypothetical protein